MSHFYDTKGNPVYEVPKADGSGLKATTLREARLLKLVPGVTDVLKMAANEGLIVYFQEQLLEAVIALSHRIPDPHDLEGILGFKKEVIGNSKLHAKRASDRGTEIHDALERAYTGKVVGELQAFTDPVIKFLQERFNTAFIAEKSFASTLGFGGKTDLHAPCSVRPLIIDFKTKPDAAFAEGKKLEQYDNHFQQLAAYRLGLDLPRAECYNLFISHETPGRFKLVPEVYDAKEEQKIQKGERMFLSLLEYYKEKNSFDPSFTKEVRANEQIK